MALDTLNTPCLLVDEARLRANAKRMLDRMAALDIAFRPHLKTAKSFEIARLMMASPAGPATVSTLAEAEYFAAAGITDLLYGVGIAPAKLPRVSAIRASGADLAVVVDSVEQARAVATHSRDSGDRVPALIEVDVDGHRAGVPPDDTRSLLAIAAQLDGGGLLRGVFAHAGASYALHDPHDLQAAARAERDGAISVAATLRTAGFACSVVSVGSTPTASLADDLAGVTEVRAGVYIFGDLCQVGIGTMALDDLAMSVLATVIGRNERKGWAIVDAGWSALSSDRATARQAVDQGYGLVCREDGDPYPDMIVAGVSQEHGIVTRRPGSTPSMPDLAIGDRVRILPNHACATAMQHARYHIVDAAGRVAAIWPRLSGW